MAKTISDEDIRLNIIVNGNSAQKELLDLDKNTRKLNATQKELRAEKTRLITAGKKESQEYKNVTAEIKKNNAILKTNKARIEALQKQIGITGLTMRQLKQRASTLRLALNNTIPGGADEKRYNAELGKISARLTELKLKGKQTKLSLSGVANGFNKYAALGASVIATTTGVVIGMQKMIDYNGKLSDAQSDVQKTTGLTKDEVDELTKSFGILNTRTSRMDLLKIAEEGGRIGIAKEEIGDFVRVMNQANVALGDSFQGGPEEVASKLGKLKLLFKETKDLRVDTAYNAIGSAINELGANGVATEANIAEFTTRIGSLSNALKPTIADALGLGAAFEESGVQAEISGRAYSIFLGQAAKESEKFAKVMGISTEEVENLINTNPTEFFLQFSQRLAETQKTGTDTAKTMADLGLSADGVRKIVGAAGNNTERFREMLELSNKSMVESTSLTNEYNIKNNNLAANLEKVQKKMMALFSSDFIINGLESLVTWFGKVIGAVEDSDGSVTKWKAKLLNAIKIVAVLIAGLVSYNGALKLVALYQNGLTSSTYLLTIAQKANALTGGLLKTAATALQYVYFSLTLQTNKATIAQKAFNLATKMNPIGLIIGIVTAATAAYFLYSKEIDSATKNQQTLNALKVDAKKQIQDEVTELNNLLTIARDVTQSQENRRKAIKKINDLSPQYLKNLTLEKINTLEAKTAIDQYVTSLEKKSMAEAFAQKRTEVNKKLLDAISDEETRNYGGFFSGPETDFKDFYEKEQQNISEFKRLTNGWNTYKFDAYRDYKKGIQDAKDELQFLQEEEKKFIQQNANLYLDEGGVNAPNEGDQKYIGKDLFIFQGGKWVYQKPIKPANEQQPIEAQFTDLIENTKNRALEEISINLEKDLEILNNSEASEKEKLKLQKAYAKARGLISKQEAANEKITVSQRLQVYSNMFGGIASLLGNNTKAGKAAAIAQATMNTYQGVTEVWSTKSILPEPFATISRIANTAVVLGSGLASVRSIKNTQTPSISAPGFEGGLYPVQREQDGKLFNAGFGGQTKSGMVNKPTVFMAGENGPELIVDSKAFKQINPDVKNSFMREIARVKGFEGGLYNTTNITNVAQNDTDAPQNDTNDAQITTLTQLVSKNNDFLETLIRNPLFAVMSDDLRSMKKLQKRLDDYKTFDEKNKR
tara:strand:- start:34611 stop:38108 length:3498 start_codon:yes stop_codon:yes gene_type:complete